MNFFDSANKNLHLEFDQLKRQKSALSLKMLSIDRNLKIGTIKNYSVTLENCSCIDFSRRKKPCKHMYRLAMDLGIFEVAEKNLKDFQTKAKFRKNFQYSYHPLNYSEKKISSTPKNFTVIDFETANDNFDSVCQIGIVVVENNLIVEEKSFYICPPYNNFTNTHIHGITFDDVKFSPTFAELWLKINKYFEGKIISAYNLMFDWSCLAATLDYYKISIPKFSAFDILESSRNYLVGSKFESHSLVNVAKALKIPHYAHEALSDSEVAAKVQIFISEKFPESQVEIYCL